MTVGVLVPRGFIGILGRASFVFPRSASALGAEVAFTHGTLRGGLCPLAHTFGRVFLSACGEGEIARAAYGPSTFGERGALHDHRGGPELRRVALGRGPANGSGMVPLIREPFTYTLPKGQTAETLLQLPVTFAGDVGVGVLSLSAAGNISHMERFLLSVQKSDG